MQYPKWKYHKTKSPELVRSIEDEKKLGKEWAETPAAFGIETHPEKKIVSTFQLVELKKNLTKIDEKKL